MNKLIWNNSFSVNVAEIDAQHQQLVRMYNELYDAVSSGKDSEMLGHIVSGLVEYTGTHFRTEEKYFAQFDYPDTEKHIGEHQTFITKVSEIIDEWTDEKQTLSGNILEFLDNWLEAHIKGSDKNYAAFFNEHGLK